MTKSVVHHLSMQVIMASADITDQVERGVERGVEREGLIDGFKLILTSSQIYNSTK